MDSHGGWQNRLWHKDRSLTRAYSSAEFVASFIGFRAN